MKNSCFNGLSCVAFAAAVVVSACGTAADSQLRSTGSVHLDMAIVEIARTRSMETSDVAHERLADTTEASAAREGLFVHRVVYSPPGTAHMESVVLVAERDSLARVIRSVGDLIAVAAYPRIDAESLAIALCSDLVRWIGPASVNLTAPRRFDGPEYWRGAGWEAAPKLAARVRAPVVSIDSLDRRRVDAWFAEPGMMVRYDCTLSDTSTPSLVRADSLLGLGTMPEDP